MPLPHLPKVTFAVHFVVIDQKWNITCGETGCWNYEIYWFQSDGGITIFELAMVGHHKWSNVESFFWAGDHRCDVVVQSPLYLPSLMSNDPELWTFAVFNVSCLLVAIAPSGVVRVTAVTLVHVKKKKIPARFWVRDFTSDEQIIHLMNCCCPNFNVVHKSILWALQNSKWLL